MDVLSKFEHFGLALLVEKFWFELEPAGAAAIHQYKFRPGCPVETLVRYGTQRERWIDAEITKVNPKDHTYDLLVLQPKRHGVNPNAVHVPESYIRNKTYKPSEVVET